MLDDLRTMIWARLNRATVYSSPDFWDGKAAKYCGEAVSMWANNNLNRLYDAEQRATLERFLGDITGRDVLDLGCGTGRLSRWMAARGARVTGIDFAPRVIALAQNLSAHDNATFRLGSMFELEDIEKYDVVVSVSAIAMACRDMKALEDVLWRLWRALRSNGRLIIVEPIHRGLLHRVLNIRLRDFVIAVEKSGFTVLDATQLHFWPVRVLLAYFELPPAVTKTLYELGQLVMHRVFWARALGDYKALLCAKVHP